MIKKLFLIIFISSVSSVYAQDYKTVQEVVAQGTCGDDPGWSMLKRVAVPHNLLSSIKAPSKIAQHQTVANAVCIPLIGDPPASPEGGHYMLWRDLRNNFFLTSLELAPYVQLPAPTLKFNEVALATKCTPALLKNSTPVAFGVKGSWIFELDSGVRLQMYSVLSDTKKDYFSGGFKQNVRDIKVNFSTDIDASARSKKDLVIEFEVTAGPGFLAKKAVQKEVLTVWNPCKSGVKVVPRRSLIESLGYKLIH